jgi:signal transduction histidine kinase
MPQLKILHKGLLIVLVPFAINLVWFALFFNSLQRAGSWSVAENREAAMIVLVSRCISMGNQFLVNGAEYLESGDDPIKRKQLIRNTDSLFKYFDQLRALTKGDSELGHNIEKLTRTMEAQVNATETFKSAFASKSFARDVSGGLPPNLMPDLSAELFSLLHILTDRGELLDKTMEMEKVALNKSRLIGYTGLALNIMLACALVLLFQKHITRRIAILVHNANALSDSARVPEEVSGSDELSQLNTELQAVRAELLAGSAFRHAVMQMMAQNIQTPLIACRESISKLDRSQAVSAAAGIEKPLQSLRIATGACLRLVDDLLLLDNLESGSLQLTCERQDIRQIVDSAIVLVKSLASIKNVQLTNESSSVDIDADFGRIQQVLVNLLANAIKFTHTGTTVVIRTSVVGVRLRVSVVDQGPGQKCAGQFIPKILPGRTGQKSRRYWFGPGHFQNDHYRPWRNHRRG